MTKGITKNERMALERREEINKLMKNYTQEELEEFHTAQYYKDRMSPVEHAIYMIVGICVLCVVAGLIYMSVVMG